ncbi:methyltransferase FkbM domain protein [Bordetella holmesii 70147]|nr:methyltransferase FkbM domain protein [Bordetella holmesii 70147]
MIKADVEGGELGILEGATRHLADSQCRLSIAAYHYPNDLLSLSRFMQSLGRKRHSVRGHHASVWDLVLYVHEDAR